MFSRIEKVLRSRSIARTGGFGTVVALASLLSFGGANAASVGFTIVGGSTGAADALGHGAAFDPGGWSSGANFGLGQGSAITVFNGNFGSGQGLFVSDGTGKTPLGATLTYTYEGFEAAYTNVAFTTPSNALFVNYNATVNATPLTASVVGQSQTVGFNFTNANPALVPFLFQSISGGTTATNGGSVTSTAAIAFVVVNNGLTAYAFFDDSGAGPDADYDDMVVRIDYTPPSSNGGSTPLPAALPLFATGLGAMGLVGWRRKRKTAA
jgi:hypothetical protein